MSSNHRATYMRSILASLIAAVALAPLGIWARRLDLGAGVVPLFDAHGRSYWIAGIVISLVVAGIFQLLDRDAVYALATENERGVRYEPVLELPLAWIVPFVSGISATMLLAIYHAESAIICIPLGVFMAVATGSISHHHLFDVDVVTRERARNIYTILIHVVAFFALSMVYINKVRSVYSATAVLIVSVLLLFQITEGEDTLFTRRLAYGLAGGVMLGEITWVLNYWKATGWTGGAALLVFFYLAAGLILNQVRQGVKRRDLLEYGGVSALAFVIVLYSLFS